MPSEKANELNSGKSKTKSAHIPESAPEEADSGGDPYKDPFDDPDGYGAVQHMLDKQKAADATVFGKKAEEIQAIRAAEPDIVKRAIDLEKYMLWKVWRGSTNGQKPTTCAENLNIALRMMFGDDPHTPRPHYDQFRAATVDQLGEKINPHYHVMRWVEAFGAVGLTGLSAAEARQALREYAVGWKSNDLCQYIEGRMVEWDGTKRLEVYLWELFKAFDTKFNRLISRYFWQSFYMRCMHPGCDAPIVVCLIGDQLTGKSFFTSRLVQITTGNPELDSVKLDLRDIDRFLRQITGHSNIATIPEMRGYLAADHAKTKDFVTQKSDSFDQKWEPHVDQQRQWILTMDSNGYEGIQRDETGNRRFAPLFVAQLPDVDDKPAWEVKHTAADGEKFNAGPFIASQQFEDDVWQLFAEARAWHLENGDKGYANLVHDAATAVQHFSDAEMRRGSGTLKDQVIDTYLDKVIGDATMVRIKRRDGSGGADMFIEKGELIKAIVREADRPVTVYDRALSFAMKARGARDHRRTLTVTGDDGNSKHTGRQTGFIFEDCDGREAVMKRIFGEPVPDDGGKGDTDTGGEPESGKPDSLNPFD